MSIVRTSVAVLCACLPVWGVSGQQPEAEQEPGVVTIGEQGSEQDPLAGRDRGLAAEAERAPEVNQVEGVLGVPAISVQIDPRVLGVAPGEPLPALRREGEAVRKRDGRLLPAGERGYAVFILDADPAQGDEQPLAMVVAPCLTLESMERLIEDRGDRLRFTITGEVHTYRGVNYLLPTAQPTPWLVAEEPEGELAEQSPEAETETEEKAAADAEAAASEAGPPADNVEAEAPRSADQVLDELLNLRSDVPEPVAPARPSEAGDVPPARRFDPVLLGLDPDQPRAELKQEGEFLIARAGRLIRSSDGAHALFVLDADQQGAPEPPLIMQACKLLEQMESTVREQGDTAPFIVTGQVYTYRGANYLMPTIVKREFDRGNLE